MNQSSVGILKGWSPFLPLNLERIEKNSSSFINGSLRHVDSQRNVYSQMFTERIDETCKGKIRK